MSFSKRLRNIQWSAVVWLTIVWVLLWGEFSWGNILAGVLLSVFVQVLTPLPPISFKGTVRPWYVLVLVAHFFKDLFASSFQVAWQAFKFGTTPRGAIVRVKLRNDSDLYMTLTSELSCLVPGSLVIEAHQMTSTIYLHVLDLEQSGGADRVRQHILELEARVMRALASTEELRRAGVQLRPLAGQSDRLVDSAGDKK